jgi:hypothetical protein
MNRNTKIDVVLIVLWGLLVLTISITSVDGYSGIDWGLVIAPFILYGFIPLTIIWGIAWIMTPGKEDMGGDSRVRKKRMENY